MRPLLLKGHERPLTFVKYNREGDLLFTCAKDHTPTVWFGDDGMRLGTYKGHNGAVWTCDVTYDSAKLFTASADTTVKLWDVKTGQCKHTFGYEQPARGVSLSLGDTHAVITTDPFMGAPAAVRIVRVADDVADQTSDEVQHIPLGLTRINRCVWGPLNRTVYTGGEDGALRVWDVETGKMVAETQDHKKNIMDLKFNDDMTQAVTCSIDKTCKLYDPETLTCLKTYVCDRPLNACAIAPFMEHVFVGGGQDAMSVTTSSHKAGKFETKVYHKIFEEEIGGIKGHFGPINALCIAPDGRSFATGGEEGYVRVHHLDADYFRQDGLEGLKDTLQQEIRDARKLNPLAA